MRYAVSPEQKKFFNRHGSIIFEALWDPETLQGIKKGLAAVLAMRLSIPIEQLGRSSRQQRYMVGRDIWRGSTALKKVMVNSGLADLAAELLDVRPLRLAYDQYLPGLPIDDLKLRFSAEPKQLEELLERKTTLEQISSVQGVVGGMVVCIEAATPLPPNEGLDEVPWPEVPGSGVFFKAQTPLDFRLLQSMRGGGYVLITYCRERSLYICQNGDPQVHALKHLGYVFGDRLNDKLNPIVVR